MYFIYLLVAILMFGILIGVHEFGHFATAKLTGVKVNEFAIGMGPLLWKKQKGETRYSLRVFPIGGYCAMEGEDEETGDPRAFTAQPVWKKLIILVAGSFMNFLFGFLVAVLLMSGGTHAYVPVIDSFLDGFPLEGSQGLMEGDRILSVNGQRVWLYSDVELLLDRNEADTVDLVVERDGAQVSLDNLPLTRAEYEYNGSLQWKYGLNWSVEKLTAAGRLRLAGCQTMDFVRMVWFGLSDLLHGRAGLQDMSGPIGIVDTISDAGAQAKSLADGLYSVMTFVAFIAVNLAVMNMLPIPALDGGRVFFVLVNALFTLVTRKKIDPKYEGYIHTAGFLLLIALMVVVALNDVWKIIG